MVDKYSSLTFVSDGKKHGSETPPADLEQLAQRVMVHLRSGAKPDTKESETLNSLPLIDELRNLIKSDDLDWIWQAIDPQGTEQTALYISLLRAHTNREDVQGRLRTMWGSASPYVRSHLLWRILDDETLPDAWHTKLFEFAVQEKEIFQKSSAQFLGSTDELVLIRALERFGDPAFPDSKKWAYLCSVAGVGTYSKAARSLVSLGRLHTNPFVRNVAEILLKTRFTPSAA